MNEYSSYAGLLKFFELEVYPFCGNLFVPYPERNSPVFGRRIGKPIGECLYGINPFLDRKSVV
jgi:hypothetical protein